MNAVEWIEGRSGFALRPWQTAAVLAMFPPDGSPSEYETFLISTVKKAGKTSLNAWCTLYGALHFPAGETAYVVANDQAQAEENTFDLIAQAVRDAGLEESGEALIRSDRISFPATGTRIVALPADFAGSAGGRFGITSFTELWAYRHEAHVRLFEELTPNPNRRSLRIVDSYAGFAGDAPVLEPLWQRAVSGERISEDMPIFTDGKLWAFIDQGHSAQERAWLGDDPEEMAEYYAEQARSLRPGTYNRLHLNQWQSAEEAFVTAELWDACRVEYPPERAPGPIYVGLDAATKHDCAAVIAVAPEGERLRVVAQRIWTPRFRRPIDLEDIEDYLIELGRRFQIATVAYDPYQLARSASELGKRGLPMEEFAQTSGNLTAAGQALFEAIQERRLAVSDDDKLREHVLNAVAVNSSRGWRLAKEKSSRKIDAAVALSFAVLAAIRRPAPGPVTSTQFHPWGRKAPSKDRKPGWIQPSKPAPLPRVSRPRPPWFEGKTGAEILDQVRRKARR
jgi:phage terminase large subunit-like protein